MFNYVLLDEIYILSYNPFKNEYSILTQQNNVDEIFPDKFRNLYGYEFKLLFFNQFPQIFLGNGVLFGYESSFLIYMSQHLDFTVSIVQDLSFMDTEQRAKIFEEILESNQAMSFNVALGISPDKTMLEQITNFDSEAYCALIPIQPRKSFLDDILSPYENSVWIVCLASIFFGSCVWTLIRSRSSVFTNTTWDFVFNSLALFLLQSPELNHLRFTQKIILPFFVFVMFILGTAYQSQIISLMFSARNETSINNLKTLLSSDMKLAIESTFFSNFDRNAIDESRITNFHELSIPDLIGFAENRTVIITRCELALLLQSNNENAMKKFYLMEGSFFNQMHFYYFNKKCHFKNKVIDYNFRYFESGLRTFSKKFLKQYFRIGKFNDFIDSEDYLLNFEDVWGAFVILFAGLLISLLGFILELMYYYKKRQISNFNWEKNIQKKQKHSILCLKKHPLKQKKTRNYLKTKNSEMRIKKCQKTKKFLVIKCEFQKKRKGENRNHEFLLKLKKSGVIYFLKKSPN